MDNWSKSINFTDSDVIYRVRRSTAPMFDLTCEFDSHKFGYSKRLWTTACMFGQASRFPESCMCLPFDWPS